MKIFSLTVLFLLISCGRQADRASHVAAWNDAHEYLFMEPGSSVSGPRAEAWENLAKSFSHKGREDYGVLAKSATRFLHDGFAPHTVDDAMGLLYLTYNDGCIELRSYLRQVATSGQSRFEHHVALLDAVTTGPGHEPLQRTLLPEVFDIYVAIVQNPTDSMRIRAVQYLGASISENEMDFPPLRKPWSLFDVASTGLLSVLGEHCGKPGMGRYVSSNETRAEREEKRQWWRREIVGFLKRTPEVRSFWIQKYVQNLQETLLKAKTAGDVDWAVASRQRIPSTLQRLESEFAVELADRRGICAIP